MQAQQLDGTLCSTQFIALMLQEALNECRQLTREQLVMVVMGRFRICCSFMHFAGPAQAVRLVRL